MSQQGVSSLPCIAVFGASGGTGGLLLAAAQNRNIRVRALFRPGSEPSPSPAGVEVLSGNLTAEADVQRALEGMQAVCCVFGPRPPYRDVFSAEATQNVIVAMQQLNLRRLVCQTGAMIGMGMGDLTFPMRLLASLFRAQRPAVAADRAAQERLVKESGLDWVLVKPPRLTEGPPRRRVRVGPRQRIGLFSAISRADLAEFLLEELVAGQYHQQAVYIAG